MRDWKKRGKQLRKERGKGKIIFFLSLFFPNPCTAFAEVIFLQYYSDRGMQIAIMLEYDWILDEILIDQKKIFFQRLF